MKAIFKTLASVLFLLICAFAWYYCMDRFMYPYHTIQKSTENTGETMLMFLSMFGIYHQWNWFYKRFKSQK